MTRLMTRWMLPLIAALSLGLAIFWVMAVRPSSHATSPLLPPPEAPDGQSVAAVGLVEPETETIEVSCAVPGLITNVHVHAGDTVKSGQPLFSVDDRNAQAELRLRLAAADAAQTRLAKLQQEPRPETIPPVEARVAEAKAGLADAETQVSVIESVSDRRAVREEEVLRRRLAQQAAQARVDQAERELALLKAGAWAPDVAVAKASVAEEEAAASQARTEIERLTVRAPAAGTILQSKIRAGQYAACGAPGPPLMLLGGGTRLNVRAEVDESEAWRVRPGAPAVASMRGEGNKRFSLEFVRIEPQVVPKKALAGDSVERVDTRVLQAIYRFRDLHPPVYNGQQMEVYIEAAASPGAAR
jgi:HlyD family secretion protein